jgi:hypothetical protein
MKMNYTTKVTKGKYLPSSPPFAVRIGQERKFNITGTYNGNNSG